MNKLKTSLATLIVGSSLILSGCPDDEVINVQGEVTRELTLIQGFNGITSKTYVIKDKTDKEYFCSLVGSQLDPFNVGDCAKVTLGSSKTNFDEYVDNKLVKRRIYDVLKFEQCEK